MHIGKLNLAAITLMTNLMERGLLHKRTSYFIMTGILLAEKITMTASLLDGKALAARKNHEIRHNITHNITKGQRAPGLAVILVGSDPASEIYVNNKRKACAEVGIISHSFNLPATTSEQHLIALIEQLNQARDIDGILVQLPLPEHIDSYRIIECINPHKDIDGFHPYNLGRLAQRIPLLRPCTPLGILELLEAYNLPLRGKHCVVVGASNIVGRPMALELLIAGATVTVCHRFTTNLEQHIRMADAIIVATGKQDVVDVNWLNEKQIIIDVGIHRLENGKLRGDIDFDKALERVAWITPVPGGVGPMTISTLLQNTLFAQQQCRIDN